MRRNKKSHDIDFSVSHLSLSSGIGKAFSHFLAFAVMFAVVLGISMMLNGMLLIEASVSVLVLTSFLSVLIAYPLFKSGKATLLSVLVLILCVVALTSSLGVNAKNLFVDGVKGIFNRSLNALRRFGFNTINYVPATHYSDTATFFVISLFAAILYSVFCIRRTRVLPMFFLILGIAIPIMACGAPTDMSAFAVLIVGMCGMAAMSVNEREKTKNRYSGFSGLICAALAIAIILSPIVSVKEPMKDLDSFTKLVNDVKLFVEELFTKNEAGRNIPSEAKRTARASKRRFNDRKIMTVYSNVYTPVYLRTWAGGEYSNNTWYSVDFSDPKTVFGEYASKTDPYSFTRVFLGAVERIGYDLVNLGYKESRMTVDMAVKEKSLPIIGLSPLFDDTYLKTINAPVSTKYDGYYYSDKSFKSVYTGTSLTELNNYNNYFSEIVRGYLQYMGNYAGGGSLPVDANEYARLLAEKYGYYGLISHRNDLSSYSDFIESEYYQTVTDEFIDKAVQEIFDQTDIEEYYKVTRDVLREGQNGYIKRVIGSRTWTYYLGDYRENTAYVKEIAALVAQYLEKCKYSLDPKTQKGLSVMEDFLFVSKEGYCVQYATAGALIMRRLGFNARYAEGYIAKSYSINNESNSVYKYVSDVIDRNAHAWVEVWIDGFGWVQLEMTPGYFNVQPDVPVSSAPIISTTPDDTTPEDTTTGETSTGEETSTGTETGSVPSVTIDPPVTSEKESEPYVGTDNKLINTVIYTIVICGSVGLVFGACVGIVRRRTKRRKDLIRKCSYHTALTGEERARMGRGISTAVGKALAAYKLLPIAGELPEAFAERIQASLGVYYFGQLPIKCIEAMSHHEYGGYMNDSDLEASASFLRALSKNARKNLGVCRFLYYRMKGIL